MAHIPALHASVGVGALLSPVCVVEATRGAERGDAGVRVVYAEERQRLGWVSGKNEAEAEGCLLVRNRPEREVVPISWANRFHLCDGTVESFHEGYRECSH